MTKIKVLWLVISRVRNWGPLLLARLGLQRFPKTVVMRNGLTIEMPLADTGGWGEVFEPLIADVYHAPVNFHGIIVDIGANAGAFTLRAAHQNPRAKIFAFEPQETVAALLRKNLSINLIMHAEVFVLPVTADGRLVEFTESVGRPGSSGIQFEAEGRGSRKSTTLAELPWQQASAAFVKLDCEGAEGEICRWIAEDRTKLPARMQIVAEYHPWCPIPMAETIERLKSAGFRCSTFHAFHESYLRAERTG